MFELSAQILMSHTGPDGRLGLTGALALMQDCSQLWLDSEPALLRYFEQNSISQFVACRQVELLRMPAYREKVRVQTRIFAMKRQCGYRNTAILDEAGNPCVVGWGLGAFVCLLDGRLERLPAEVANSVTIDPELPLDIVGRKVKMPLEPPTQHPPVPVRRVDIDFNGHMNNIRYLEAAMEYLPDGFDPGRFRVEYRTPVPYGEHLHPAVVERPGAVWVSLNSEAGGAYAVLEFTARAGGTP